LDILPSGSPTWRKPKVKLMEAILPHCGQRIPIAGTSDSGKTTLARQVAQQLQTDPIELDTLH
jgi:adenylylsulfate kinase-like enzyme